jgi:hypothetical protein
MMWIVVLLLVIVACLRANIFGAFGLIVLCRRQEKIYVEIPGTARRAARVERSGRRAL